MKHPLLKLLVLAILLAPWMVWAALNDWVSARPWRHTGSTAHPTA